MLGVPRCVEVEDGSYVYLDPSLTVVWADGITIAAPDGKLRVVYHDSTQILRRADADRLVRDGLAAPVGGRLFEQPELMDAVFAWDNSSEADFIVRMLGPAATGRGLEYGCGTGRILLKLRERGLTVDGVDASEPAIRYLRERLPDPGRDRTELVVADIAACAFPGRYDYAVAGLNTLRYLPSHAALRRHLHLAALTVRPGGVYVAMVDSWQPGATPEYGSAAEWPATLPDGREVTVRWTRVRHDPASRMDLESVELTDGQGHVFREFQTQLALPVPDWLQAFTETGEWRVEATYLDGYPEPQPVDDKADPTDGNFWFILQRTDRSAGASFTR
jgi:SAM-dependent methyltransferase